LVLWRVWADRRLLRKSVLGGWNVERGVSHDVVASAGGGWFLLKRGECRDDPYAYGLFHEPSTGLSICLAMLYALLAKAWISV
jgi:hypothetical protein